jgi:type I restriction enzyme, R subunit
MSRSEAQARTEIIDSALGSAGWEFDTEVLIGPGRVSLAGQSTYEGSQELRADYILRMGRMPLAVLEVKAGEIDAAEGVQQGSRYANRLGLRFSILSNGRQWLVTDNETGEYENLDACPYSHNILDRYGLNIKWNEWQESFNSGWYEDGLTQKRVRPYQEMAIFEALRRFSGGKKRVLLLMATGTGKTFTVAQLVWKLMKGGNLKRKHVLFLTDRNNLKDQAFRAFNAFSNDERVSIDKDAIRRGEHTIGKVFFANYQNLDEELDGKKLYEHYDTDFFDLVIIDECHRSAFGDWFGILEHFQSAYQLGLTATPRELDQSGRSLSDGEKRRDTYEYFGEPVYTYSLRKAIEDGYLVPCLLEERITNLDEEGYTGPDGKVYTTSSFEREIRIPERTRMVAEDLWQTLVRYELQDEKTIVFCVDDIHAAYMVQELNRISGDPDYAARITRSARHSRELEKNFAVIGRSRPRVAVTVDLLTTGYDAPDVKNIVFVRPIKSSILYKQMKGRGTRLCGDIDKRYFTIFDYSGATRLEDTEFDGHPANVQKATRSSGDRKPPKKRKEPVEIPIAENVSVSLSRSQRYISFADGRRIPFEEYVEMARGVIQTGSSSRMDRLIKLWMKREKREDFRRQLKEEEIHVSAFSHWLELGDTDEVDILAKIGFDLGRVPTRRDRVNRFWQQDEDWLMEQMENQPMRLRFWGVSLSHYEVYGIDQLEQSRTYGAPHFVNEFGTFSGLLDAYGGGKRLKSDLEDVKSHLYASMTMAA